MYRKLTIALCVSALVLPTAFFAGALVRELRTPRYDLSALTKIPKRVQLMPSSGLEWLEIHQPDHNGQDRNVEIVYRNQARGLRTYLPDEHGNVRLREFRLVTVNGDVLTHLHFSPDGRQIVSGFERRPDGTMIRKAEQRADGIVVLTTFWQDGITPFSVEARGIDSKDKDTRFYHRNGQQWTHQVSGFSQSLYETVMLREEAWGVDGVRLHVRTRDLEGVGTGTFFRPDGTTSMRQFYAIHKFWADGDEGGRYEVKARVLRNVEEFDDKGSLVRRYTTVTNGSSVLSIEHFDSAGAVSRVESLEQTETATPLPDQLGKWEPAPLNPTALWEEEEKKVVTAIR